MDISNFKERCCSFFITFLTIVSFGAASTVYSADLELEGNILTDATVDWEDMFDVTGINVPTEAASLPAGYAEAVFIRDFVPGASGPDISTFATGSKDTLNITPGWECTRSNNVNDKTDVVNAYAVAATNGEVVVYFGMERYANDGDGNIGFWFLKDGSVGCAVGTTGPKTLPFTGNHSDGDVLIVSEFSNGGDIATIAAYKWVGGAGGYLDPTPIAAGGQCVGGGAGQSLCAIVNDTTLTGFGAGTDVPWLTETKQPGNTPSNDLALSEFFEGRINLSALGLVGCFTKYMAVTRSSTSLTSTIFDYALGDFNLCSIDATKVCRAGTEESPNPVLHPDGDKILTIFDATILNDGVATVSDVTIVEDTMQLDEEHEYCKVTAIDNVPLEPPVDITDTPYEVASSLAAEADVDVEITCLTDENGFDNKVIAAAQPFSGASNPLEAEAIAQACSLNVSPVLSVVKECGAHDGVRIVLDEGVLTFEVEVDVSVTNAPDMGESPAQQEKLNNVIVTNNEKGDGSGPDITLYLADADGNYVDGDGVIVDAANRVEYAGTPFMLGPDESAYFKSVYQPSNVDGGIGDDGITAHDGAFTDRVEASALGAISQEEIDAFDTDTCNVCPTPEDDGDH